jgi:hypothetical protein
MNYVEQKLIDLDHIIYTEYSNKIKQDTAYEEKTLKNLKTQVKLVVKDTIKNEIRRSLKENGFHDYEGQRFSDYVKNQSKTIIGKLEEDFLYYYDNSMIIALTITLRSYILDILWEIYDNAKLVEIEASDKIKEIEKQYDELIDKYIGVNNV